MTLALFIVGLLTAIGCGWNVITASGTWQHDAVWVLGGFGGAGLMVLAIHLSRASA